MMMRNWILFAVLCTLVTIGYGEDCCCCDDGISIDTIGCHKDVQLVALFDVISDKQYFSGFYFYTVTLVKPYKCTNDSICSMNPKPEYASVFVSENCYRGSELIKGERYLFTGIPGKNRLMTKCTNPIKWQDVKSDESKIIQAVESCTLTYET